MMARCEHDLSPGALTDPAIRAAGLEVARIGFPRLVNRGAGHHLAGET